MQLDLIYFMYLSVISLEKYMPIPPMEKSVCTSPYVQKIPKKVSKSSVIKILGFVWPKIQNF